MNIEGFKAYLAQIESYQNTLVICVWAGLVVTAIGALLVFLMRDSSGQEKFKFKTETGHQFNFSSSFAGGLVSFSGSFIVIASIFAMAHPPRIDGEGWRTTAMISNNEIIKAVADGSGIPGTIRPVDTNVRASGVFVDKNVADKVRDAGGEIVEFPKAKIESSDSNKAFIKAETIYFYPLQSDKESVGASAEKLDDKLEAQQTEWVIETAPQEN